MKKSNYYWFDIFKFVFAIFIIVIHTHLLSGETSNIAWFVSRGLFRLAVPSFFVMSGFFYGKKIYKKNEDEVRIVTKQYIKRLLIPYFFWLILNAPIKFMRYHETNTVLDGIYKMIKDFFFYPWGAMWYILALIVAILLIRVLSKKLDIKKIIIIGFVLYLFALLCTNYYFLFKNNSIGKLIVSYRNDFVSARNGLFEGLVFVSLGIYVYNRYYEKKINYHKCFLAMIISYVFLIAEIFLLKGKRYLDDGSLYIMMVVFIPLFIAYFSKYCSIVNTTIVRKYSTSFYFLHAFIIGVVELIFKICSIEYSYIGEFLIVLTIVFILSTIAHFINNEKINKVLF